MERGECSFVSKAVRAQEAGAVAAIITDQVRCFESYKNKSWLAVYSIHMKGSNTFEK